jgi:ribosomal protein L14
MPAVVVRQRKAWRRKDGVFLYFEVSTPLSPIECYI